jgi:hypothetical protein
MGYRDRMRKLDHPEDDQQETLPSSQTSEESSLVLAAELQNPVAERLGVAVKYMLSLFAASKNAQENQKLKIGMKIGSKLIGEMMNDLRDSDLPPAIMELYLKQVGAMVLWTATGVKDPSLPWPPDFEI